MLYQRRTKTVPLPLKLSAFAVLLTGLYACLENPLVGLLFVAVASLTLTIHDGVEIDFSNKRIRLYWSLVGLKFGTWDLLPAVDRLTLVTVKHTYTVFGSRTGSSTSYQQQTVEAHLYPQDSDDYYIVSTGKYEAVNADAQFLSRHLPIILEDFVV